MASRSAQTVEGQHISSSALFELRRGFDDERGRPILQLSLSCLPSPSPAEFPAPPADALSKIWPANNADERLIILENFEGVSLEAMLLRGILEPDQAFQILRSMASALDQLHTLQRSHGALQPGCILVGANQSVRIVDWMIGWNHVPVEHLAAAAEYLSPERIAGWPCGSAVDQFALGTIAHQMLFGRTPFRAASRAEVLFRVRHGLWNNNLVSDTDTATLLVYERVFAVSAGDRFPSCAAFVAALEEASRQRRYSLTPLGDDSSSLPANVPQDPLEAASLRPRRARAWWVAASIAALTAFVLGLANWRVQNQTNALNSAMESLSQNSTAAASLNGQLTVCNTGLSPVSVRELAVAYWGASHRLQVFNSTHYTQQGWSIAPASSQLLSWPQGQGSVWNGSVLFYFARVRSDQSEYLVSGRWDSGVHDCLDLHSDATRP